MKTTIKTVLLAAILILFTSLTFGNNNKVITIENEIISSTTIDVEDNLELEDWMIDYHTWNNITTRHEKMNHKMVKRGKHRSHKGNMRHIKNFSERGNFSHKGNVKGYHRSEITPEKLYKIADMMEKRAEMIREKANLMEKEAKE